MSCFKTSTCPPESVNSILAKPTWLSWIVADFSLSKKSLPFIDETWVAELELHAPMECGLAIAYFLTALAARRSELPSRKTGLTADPFILS